jgi:hypothetical protein
MRESINSVMSRINASAASIKLKQRQESQVALNSTGRKAPKIVLKNPTRLLYAKQDD